MDFFYSKEKFTPTYYDSEQYYKQKQDNKEQSQINKFNPSISLNKNIQTGYNNQFSKPGD